MSSSSCKPDDFMFLTPYGAISSTRGSIYGHSGMEEVMVSQTIYLMYAFWI